MSENYHHLKARFEKRNRALTAFNRWEADHLSSSQSSEQVFASLGTVYELLPPETRHREEDPDRSGIQAMHRALQHLK